MAISTPDFDFAAPPKSGCRWMHGALKEAFGNDHVQHGSLHTIPEERTRPLVSLVRDPADWARSYFTNINCPLDCPADAFLDYSRGDAEPDAAGLRRFVCGYIAAGARIGDMFAAYRADTIFRIEDCPLALQRFLGRRIFDRDRRATRNPLIMPAYLRRLIYEHEHEFCRNWEYS